MYCPECGKQVDAGAAHCLNCGASLSSPAQGLAPTPPPPAKDVETYLVYSIIVMICCCQPLGIVATVYSAMATGEAKSGQYEVAYQHAQQAKMWCWIAFGIGLAFNVIVALIYGAAIVAGNM